MAKASFHKAASLGEASYNASKVRLMKKYKSTSLKDTKARLSDCGRRLKIATAAKASKFKLMCKYLSTENTLKIKKTSLMDNNLSLTLLQKILKG